MGKRESASVFLMPEPDSADVAPEPPFPLHRPNRSPEVPQNSTSMRNMVGQISMEGIVVEDTKIKPSENSSREEFDNEMLIHKDQTEDQNSLNFSTISHVKNECKHISRDKTEEAEGLLLVEAIHPKESTQKRREPVETGQSNASSREDNFPLTIKTPQIIDVSLLDEECPIACKRLKMEMDDSERLSTEENYGLVLKKLKEPKRSWIPEQLLKIGDFHPSGAVSICPSASIICQMEVQSKVVTVLGVRWCIFVRMESEHVSLFLKCLEEEDEFTCTSLSLTYKVHHPTDSGSDIVKITNHVFNSKESDWGYKHLLKAEELPDYIQSDGTIFFSCEFVVCSPQGIRFLDGDTRIPIGLMNQGATCYMNSAIQILFSTKCLRKAILELDFSKEDKGVVQSLQTLFYHMHTSCKAVSTEDLTNSFGWKNTEDSFAQHDVQEMMKILLEKIEIALKGTQNEWMVDDLFKTRTRTFIKCLDVDFESGKDEYCLDIQLPVKRQSGSDEMYDVMSALRDVTRPEMMDGDNKYEAEGHGLTRATKGSNFHNFSKVLHLQLLRFQLDWESGESVKLHDRVEFCDVLDLNEFIEDKNDGTNHEYALHGVVVHSGKMNEGHYVSYICKYPGADQQKWFRFDDSTVTEVTKECVMSEEHFGNGLDDSFTAYMLTYIRTDSLREILADFTLSVLSPRLREKMEMERRLRKWNEIDKERQEKGMVIIRLVREPNPFETRVRGHFDYTSITSDPYMLKLRGDDPSIKLFHEAEGLVGKGNLRLFVMERRESDIDVTGVKGDVWRVKRELEHELVAIQMSSVQSILGDEGNDEYVIFILSNESIYVNQITNERHDKKHGSGKMVFIKWYNGDTHSIEYIAPLEVHGLISLSRDFSQLVCIRAHLPPSSQLQFWKENSVGGLVKLDDLTRMELEMGDVIVFELVHLIMRERSIQSLLEKSIKVSFKQCKNRLCYGLMEEKNSNVAIDPLVLSMTCTYRRLIEQLSSRIDHPSENIAIWANGNVVDIGALNEKISDAVLREKYSQRDKSTISIEFALLSVTIRESLQYIGLSTAMRTGLKNISNTEFLTKGPNLVERLKERLMGKYEIADISRLRLVWRYRQGNGYFVFQEIAAEEDIMETMMGRVCSLPGSLIVCVDEMIDEEMDDRKEDEHSIIVPLVFVKSKSAKNFTNQEPTIFIKIQKGDDNFSLKTKIEAKCGIDTLDWENIDLLSFMGSRCHNFQLKPHLGLNSLYDELREEPGLSAKRDTRLFLAIHNRSDDSVEGETPLKLSQSIVIRD